MCLQDRALLRVTVSDPLRLQSNTEKKLIVGNVNFARPVEGLNLQRCFFAGGWRTEEWLGVRFTSRGCCLRGRVHDQCDLRLACTYISSLSDCQPTFQFSVMSYLLDRSRASVWNQQVRFCAEGGLRW